jgi:hypothetical protein
MMLLMQTFDVENVEVSLESLLLAAEEVENMNMDHPAGFYAHPINATANSTGTRQRISG